MGSKFSCKTNSPASPSVGVVSVSRQVIATTCWPVAVPHQSSSRPRPSWQILYFELVFTLQTACISLSPVQNLYSGRAQYFCRAMHRQADVCGPAALAGHMFVHSCAPEPIFCQPSVPHSLTSLMGTPDTNVPVHGDIADCLWDHSSRAKPIVVPPAVSESLACRFK